MLTETNERNSPAGSARRRLVLLSVSAAVGLGLLAMLLRNTLLGDLGKRSERLDRQASEHFSKGDFERAEELWRESLECQSKLSAPRERQLALTLLNRGRALEAQDRLDSAMESYERSIDLCAGTDGDPQLLADGLSARAGINLSLDLYHRGEPDYREAVRIRSESAVEQPDRIGRDWLHLAECLEHQKRFEAADSACDSSLAGLRRTDTLTNRDFAKALIAKGRTQVWMNQAALAEPYAREGVSLCDRLYASTDPEPHRALGWLGWCLLRQGRLEEAEPLLLKSYARLSALSGIDPRWLRETAGHLAELYDHAGKPDLSAHYQLQARPPGESGSSE